MSGPSIAISCMLRRSGTYTNDAVTNGQALSTFDFRLSPTLMRFFRIYVMLFARLRMEIFLRRPESALYPSSGRVNLFSKKAQSGGPGRVQTHPWQRVHCDSVL